MRQGQVVTVGRTEWADHAFPADQDLLPVHFSIEFTADHVRVICAAGATVVADDAEETVIRLPQGLVFSAASTKFVVESSPDVPSSEPDQADAAADAEAAQATSDPQAAEGWVSAEATLDALCLAPIGDAADLKQPAALIERLVADARQADAIQAVAWILPRPDGLRWAIECVEHGTAGPSEQDLSALAVARQWCDDPTPENAAAAGRVVESVGTERSTGWLAQAAYWCGDDISGSDQVKVPPPAPLFSAAIKGALVKLAFECRPDDPTSVFAECLARAHDRLPV